VRFLDFQQVDEAQRQLIDELEEELQTAHDMQMRLMPTESPQIAGFDIAGRCLPANHVGGDLFQYFPQDGKLAISLADVTGHAMEAAIPMVMFSGMTIVPDHAADHVVGEIGWKRYQRSCPIQMGLDQAISPSSRVTPSQGRH